jgi:hypothetical protein
MSFFHNFVKTSVCKDLEGLCMLIHNGWIKFSERMKLEGLEYLPKTVSLAKLGLVKVSQELECVLAVVQLILRVRCPLHSFLPLFYAVENNYLAGASLRQ